MSNIVTIGFTVEGSTDKRFLEAVVRKTFEDVAFECESEIDVYDPIFFPKPLGLGFADQIKNVAEKAFHNGINILCIHADADADSDNNTFETKIRPAFEIVEKAEGRICKNIVAIVPIQMIESWMLADKDLLKTEIGTNKSNEDLEIIRLPEAIADPKETIKNALRIAQLDLPKRRQRVEIGDLYQPLGQKLKIEKLNEIPSYKKFREAVRQAFVTLNYLY